MLRRMLCLFAVFILCTAHRPARALTAEEERLRTARESGEILRLHILADSNLPEAQALKLIARDAVLAAFRERLTGDDAEELFGRLKRDAEGIRRAAEAAVRTLGYEGPVDAEVGWLELPEKRYGAVTLPAGSYRGLRVTLGRGEGRNWWCVLFPSLCLAAASEEPWQSEPAFGEVRLISHAERVLREWIFSWL